MITRTTNVENAPVLADSTKVATAGGEADS